MWTLVSAVTTVVVLFTFSVFASAQTRHAEEERTAARRLATAVEAGAGPGDHGDARAPSGSRPIGHLGAGRLEGRGSGAGRKRFPLGQISTSCRSRRKEKRRLRSTRQGFGVNAVPIGENNDPFDICDPPGFPRVELFNLRQLRIYETPKQMSILYENDQVWRNIWTDGRALPTDIAEPRWYGYSVGKWTDDTTLVVETTGLDPRTWIDNLRPVPIATN